ncbi:MAG: MoxR family ATPase [Acidobacteria bacterium]|nr:MoxR family ATPase [Acidobacteriota bacterium]
MNPDNGKLSNTSRLYSGNGSPISARNLHLPLFQRPERMDAAEFYVAEKELADAVNVALTLGQPLLVTGEPGTGKTQLAASIAHELDLPAPLTFAAKTTSSAKDLFYRYDALAHFHDSHFRTEPLSLEAYINYEALGLAILLSHSPSAVNSLLPAAYRDKGPTRTVVLVDEIDKAPRDFPNDVLNEIEHLTFTVRETGKTFASSAGYRPILILTSNSEKNLPDAFLRRCLYYHISFPGPDRLKEIVSRRLPPGDQFTSEMLDNSLRHFHEIRTQPLAKKPATAECLAWLRVLQQMELDPANLKPGQMELLSLSYCVLAKTREDLTRLQRTLASRNV